MEIICSLIEFLDLDFYLVDPHPDFTNDDEFLQAGMLVSTMTIGFLIKYLQLKHRKSRPRVNLQLLALRTRLIRRRGVLLRI